MTPISPRALVPAQSKESWITPQEQLNRIASKQLYEKKEPVSCREEVIEQIAKSAIQSTLHSIQGKPRGIPLLYNTGIRQHLTPDLLPPSLTNWYTALERIGALPRTIPPLPENIREILDSQCPIDSTRTVGETHILYLIPPGTLNELERRVSSYGQKFFQGENPLQFRYFWEEARQEYANLPENEPQWVLISKDVLPGSRKQSYEKQVEMIADLSAKSLAEYQIPSLRNTVTALFLHKVATGESLYQAGSEQNDWQSTYTLVQERARGVWPLIVGSFAASGLFVSSNYSLDVEHFGVAAVRKF